MGHVYLTHSVRMIFDTNNNPSLKCEFLRSMAVGSGWQVMVGYINLACYYIVGLPIGHCLGINQHLWVKGVWGGTLRMAGFFRY
ncbi:unnamed protein product [Sphenostylis stenocarpa]|uniref:Uncharacterized protein n=1 Tax=Sphenostylis stenocarpa TaxID=92480 RepID=A0AA86SJY3_9FABA|nr:unnamed protein product [Sphenostylis stenocarpa]